MAMKRFEKAVGKFCVLAAGTLALLAGGLSCALLTASHLFGVWYAVGVVCAAYAATILFTFVRSGLIRS